MTKKRLIAAIDAGTTGVRCCIFDFYGNEICEGYYKVPTVYPQPGYVEQNAETIIGLTFKAVADAVSGKEVNPHNITGLCITAQRNGFVPMDSAEEFLSDLFIWQDQRGARVHEWMLARLASNNISLQDFYKMTGQPFGTFQEGNKAIWLRRFKSELYDKTEKLVTPHAFLAKAFGAGEYLEEKNNLGFWLVADADKQEINADLCQVFDLDKNKFLKAVAPGTQVGFVSASAAANTGLLEGTPIYMGSGDQQCGVLGAGNCGLPDMITVCMGTAGLCIGYSPDPVRHPEGKCNVQGHPAGGYTIEGHSSSCMSSFAWVRDILFSGESPDSLLSAADGNRLATNLARQAPAGSSGVIFLPWLQGAECPHYDETARGAFIGMTLATKKGEMIRAAMEGICFENRMMIETLQESGIRPIQTLRILGGASNNEFWNQMQADIYGLPVETVTAKECAALGAAITGAVAMGIYDNYEEAVREMVHVKQRYLPGVANKQCYDNVYKIWDNCYQGLSRKTHKKDFPDSHIIT
jgi:xylulokinase